MTKQWTDAERAAFGEKMKAARAAAKAAAPQEQGDTKMATGGKIYAGRDDVPAGVRPISERPAVLGREVDAGAIAGLEQAPDTGFTTSGVLVNESQSVIGGGPVASREFGGNIAANRVPAAQPVTGPNKVPNASAVLFSDKMAEEASIGGTGFRAAQSVRQPRGRGKVEPTGLPCTCVTWTPRVNPQTGEVILRTNPETGEKEPIMEQHGMATFENGQDPRITWCTVCGGERDGIARPEHALKSNAAAQALRDAGVQVNTEGIAARAAEMLEPRFVGLETLLGKLAEKLGVE